MTFEEDYPSLFRKNHSIGVWIDTMLGKFDTLSKEEWFKDVVDTHLFSSGDIEKYCLDKSKVLEALNYSLLCECGAFVCDKCKIKEKLGISEDMRSKL